MLSQTVLLALVATVSAVPLNINLGAYSPALVVGDGEISLGNTESASALMSTLASGAAAGQGQGQQRPNEAQPQGGKPAEGQPGKPAEGQPGKPAEGQPGEGGKPAEGQPAEGGKPAEGKPAEGKPAAKRSNVRRAIESILSRRSPVPAQDDKIAAYEEAMQWIKRDINGFNAALSYAREAMKNSPKIEMGSEGAGVGIIVNAGLSVPANSAANGQKAAGEKAKRSEVVAEDESPKMTLVAITEV